MLPSLTFSGICTMIYLRVPPSSALSAITACAVEADPEKKSRIIASLSAKAITLCNIAVSFAVSKTVFPNNLFISDELPTNKSIQEVFNSVESVGGI